jgi:tRNA(Ile)-lysidine synthase
MDVVLPKSGSYVAAVSGGVDSVVLLHRLQKEPGLKLVVAHFDHGMRTDSAADRQFVQELAQSYELPFVYAEGRLGPATSEAAARAARYRFLRKTQAAGNARAIITAHHQDDVLETAILNLLRGTGRRGLTALKSRPGLVRPLLSLPKSDLLAYARTNGLAWREDPTNTDQSYLRNYVRHRILPRFREQDRANLLAIINELAVTNQELDAALAVALGSRLPAAIDRVWFTQLPHAVAREVLAAWLRARGRRDFDRPTLERLVVAAKTAAAGKDFPVRAGFKLEVRADRLALVGPER